MSFARVYKDTRLLILAPIILSFCCFINTLDNSFVYDDRYQIVDAAPVLADWRWDNLKRIVDRDIWGFFSQNLSWQNKYRSQYYRPVFAFFVMLNYKVAGLDAAYWHLVSVILHMLAVALGYLLLIESQRFAIDRDEKFDETRARRLAMIATIIFAIHPAQSESVAWVAAYVDALSAIFIFTALLAYLRIRLSDKFNLAAWVIALLSYTMAILTKEISIVVPILIVAYELFISAKPLSERVKPAIIGCLPFGLLTIGYLAIRISLFGAIRLPSMSLDFPEHGVTSLMVNIFSIPSILIKYLQITAFPFKLNPMYPISYITSPTFSNFFLPLLIITLLAVPALIIGWRSRIARVGLLLFFIPLMPALDIRTFKAEDLVHDRYLYISIIGVGLLLALAGQKVQELLASRNLNRHTISILAVALFFFFAATAVKQNQVWADEWQLWTTAQESVPNSCVVNQELGRLNEEAEHYQPAMEYFERARLNCPNSLAVYYKIGMLHGKLGNLVQSEVAFQKLATLATNPLVRSTAFFNLGLISEKRGELARAIEFYQKGISLSPDGKNAAEVRQVIAELTVKLAQQHQ